MPNARLAEFLLRRATTPERASAIAGDLLEQHNRPFQFTLAVVRVLLALQWRQILGFTTAAISFVIPVFAFARMAHRYIGSAIERHDRFKISTSASPLLFACMFFLALSAYALAKPSTRRIAVVSLGLSITAFSSAFYIYLHPAYARYSLAATLGLVLASVTVPATRRASLISLVSVTTLCLVMLIVFMIASDILLLHYHPRVHRSGYLASLFGMAWLTAFTAGTLTLGALQRRFLPTPPPVIN